MDIGICGAGIAGPTLAFWLQRSGHNVTLIEQSQTFRTGGYVIDFWGVGYTVAERMGLIEQIRQRGYQVEEVRMVNPDGDRSGGFSADVFRRMTDNRYTSLRRGDLAEILFDAVRDKTETIFGDTIDEVRDQGDHIDVTLAHGGSRRFDLLVGADGLHSRIRQLVWGNGQNFERELGYRVAAFSARGYPHRDKDVYVTYEQPGCSIARFSMRDDRTLFLFVFDAEKLDGVPPQDEAGRRALLHRIFEGAGWEARDILAAMDASEGEIYFDSVSQIEMPQWHKGRCVLVGDAAACASLLAGEGTGLAMTESYVLAGELQACGNNIEAALSAYEEKLQPFLSRKQEAARSFASSFAPKSKLSIRLQEAATRLMAIPFFADLFLGNSLKDDFDLPDYAFASHEMT